MPRTEEHRSDSQRRLSPSIPPDRDRDRSRRHKDDRSVRERRRHSRSPDRKEHRSHRHTSRSRSPYRSSRRRKEPSEDSERPRRRKDHDEPEDRHRSHKRRKSRSRSRSPPRRNHRRHRSTSPSRAALPQIAPTRSKKPLPSQVEAFTSETPILNSETSTPALDKEKPNFTSTGRLAAETKTITADDGTSIVLKYHEPPEARKPPAKDAWRLYIFKGEDLLETIELGGRSCWLIGKEKLVSDLPVEHPSCSKQHAAIQFRYVEKRDEYGDRDGRVRPYLIDLESSNGSMVNGDLIPHGRYIELLDKDVLKFGLSSREYVLMLPPS
ncbi:hypothetical protein AJ80_05256 [Polytolypa hystricis UAMH7299]|uniref:FHA domain-containing protein n=1 Tax=Polytolypa hystricis (strain UAMH7299) TaxID=1447883 RepID=A0A2B7Y5E7_POLH7|nr:hypothetical protein AJ80_05256 [Polytolypa hystricis UAMH7299]